MRRLSVFNMTTLDGFFADKNSDMSWAHKSDPEWNAFTEESAGGGGVLVFGRITYGMMASYWPTPQAVKAAPVVAEHMTNSQKVVFSRTMDKVSWKNSKLVKSDPVAEMRKMKDESGPDMVIMGSGTIVSQMAEAGLIDEFKIVINPLVLGQGKTLFAGVEKKLPLRLTSTRAFGNGNVLLCYEAQS